jgi:hypothetical protein
MGNQIDYFKNKYKLSSLIIEGKVNLKWKQILWHILKSQKIGRAWLVNYLKLDSISIVGWSDGGCWVEMAISGKSKIETCSNGLRPDSTAVNSWAVKEVSI